MNNFILKDADFAPLVEDSTKTPWGVIPHRDMAKLDCVRQLVNDTNTNHGCIGAFGMMKNIYFLYGHLSSEDFVRDGEKKWIDILSDEQYKNISKTGTICLGWCIASRDTTNKDRVIVHWIISYVKQHGVFERLIREISKEFNTSQIFPDELKCANDGAQKAWKKVRNMYELDYSDVDGFSENDEEDNE